MSVIGSVRGKLICDLLTSLVSRCVTISDSMVFLALGFIYKIKIGVISHTTSLRRFPAMICGLLYLESGWHL